MKKPEQDVRRHAFKTNQASKLGAVGSVKQYPDESSNVAPDEDTNPLQREKRITTTPESKLSHKEKVSAQMGASSSSEQAPGNNISPPTSSHSNSSSSRIGKRQRDKKKERTIDVEKLPGYRGQEQLESLVEFINSGKGHPVQKSSGVAESSNSTSMISAAHNDAKEACEESKNSDRQAPRRSKKGKSKIAGTHHHLNGDGTEKTEDAPRDETNSANITIPKHSHAIAVQRRLRTHNCSNRFNADDDAVSTSLESNTNDSLTGNRADPNCECGGSESEISQADLSGSTPASITPPTSESLKTTSSSDKSLSSYESAVGDISGSSFARDLYTYYDTEDASSEECALAEILRGEFTPVVSKRGKRVNARNRDSDEASVNFADASDSIPAAATKRPEKSFRVERASSSPPTTTPSSPTAAELSPAHFPALSRSSQEGFLAPSSVDGRRNSTGNLNTNESESHHHSIKPYVDTNFAQKREGSGHEVNADANAKTNLNLSVPPSYAKIAATKSQAVDKQESTKLSFNANDDADGSEIEKRECDSTTSETEAPAPNLLGPDATRSSDAGNPDIQDVTNGETNSDQSRSKESDAKNKKPKDSRTSVPQIEITGSPSTKKHNSVVFLNEKDNCPDVNLDGITFGFDILEIKVAKTPALNEVEKCRLKLKEDSRSLPSHCKKQDHEKNEEKKARSPSDPNISKSDSTDNVFHAKETNAVNEVALVIPSKKNNIPAESARFTANDSPVGQSSRQQSKAHNNPSHLQSSNHHNALHQTDSSIPPTHNNVSEKTLKSTKPSYTKYNHTSEKPKSSDMKYCQGNSNDVSRNKSSNNNRPNRGLSGEYSELDHKANSTKTYPRREEKNSLDIIQNYRKTECPVKIHYNDVGSFNVSECTNFMSKEWMKFMNLVERDSTAVVWYESKGTSAKL